VNQEFGENCNDTVTINVSQDESKYKVNTVADSIGTQQTQQDDSIKNGRKFDVTWSEKKTGQQN